MRPGCLDEGKLQVYITKKLLLQAVQGSVKQAGAELRRTQTSLGLPGFDFIVFSGSSMFGLV